MARPRPRRRGHIFQRGTSWVVTLRTPGYVNSKGKQTNRMWQTFPTRDQAEHFLEVESPKLRRGEWRPPTRVTFRTAAEAWHENGKTVKGWKPSTTRDYRSVLDKWLLPAFETKRLEDVTARSIEQWRREEMQAIGRAKMSRRTADKLIARTLVSTRLALPAGDLASIRSSIDDQTASSRLLKLRLMSRGASLTETCMTASATASRQWSELLPSIARSADLNVCST